VAIGSAVWGDGFGNHGPKVFEKSMTVIVAICRVSLLSSEKKYQKQNTFFVQKNPVTPPGKKRAALVVHRANKARVGKYVADNSTEIPYENRVNACKK
jgi:hypothetical protein